ncbi:hypothetical protein [Neobacillus ginsengisoli]|uniref:Uncharacterized protein n=1 Tax=Neobacillus ginsengisoli TaxID=904295 RepID=A0ABT9XNI5_9BACI|nr:hypothetical protein [Neobacillus ginsengisoli]MDQ0197081.1 hypothetical protein [Neobacillus ginsengisoli]
MYFLNEEHKKNFEILLRLYMLSRGEDRQYEATIYVAAVPSVFYLINNKEIDTTCSPLYELMKWDEEREKWKFVSPGLTGATTRMCEFALSLYNGYEVKLDDVFGTVVSREFIDVLLQAIKIRSRY